MELNEVPHPASLVLSLTVMYKLDSTMLPMVISKQERRQLVLKAVRVKERFYKHNMKNKNKLILFL